MAIDNSSNENDGIIPSKDKYQNPSQIKDIKNPTNPLGKLVSVLGLIFLNKSILGPLLRTAIECIPRIEAIVRPFNAPKHDITTIKLNINLKYGPNNLSIATIGELLPNINTSSFDKTLDKPK